MRELRSASAIHVKGGLFLLLGALASAALLLGSASVATAALLAVAVWAFARFYFYAFYVVERYVDPTFRFSGLMSVGKYWLSVGRGRRAVRDASRREVEG
jgi:hypothetical protein